MFDWLELNGLEWFFRLLLPLHDIKIRTRKSILTRKFILERSGEKDFSTPKPMKRPFQKKGEIKQIFVSIMPSQYFIKKILLLS